MTGLGKLAALAALGVVAYNVYGDKPKKDDEEAPPQPQPPQPQPPKDDPAQNVDVMKSAPGPGGVPVEVWFFKPQVKNDILKQAILSASYAVKPVSDLDPSYGEAVATPKERPANGARLFDWMGKAANDTYVTPDGLQTFKFYVMGDAATGSNWKGKSSVGFYAVMDSMLPLAKSKGLAVVLEPEEVNEILWGADSAFTSDELIERLGLT